MNQAKHKKKIRVKVISVDKQGRVITTGTSYFTYGLLIPQNLYFWDEPVPIDTAINYICNNIAINTVITVSPLEKINNEYHDFYLLSMNIAPIEEFQKSFEEFQLGQKHNVIVEEIYDDFVLLSIKDSPIKGYIEKDLLSKTVSIKDELQLYIDKVCKTPLQWMHFREAPIESTTKQQKVSNADSVKDKFESMFTDVEKSILSETDTTFIRELIETYPNFNRNDTFLEDIDFLYLKYDNKLEININKFLKKDPDFFKKENYWIHYDEKSGNFVLFNSKDIVLYIVKINEDFVITKLFHNRTDITAIHILEKSTLAYLKIDGSKIVILKKYEQTPHTFSSNDFIDYLVRMQYFHSDLLIELSKKTLSFRKDQSEDFQLLRDLLSYQKNITELKSGDIIYIDTNTEIERSNPEFYKSGIAFNIYMPEREYERLVNDEIDNDFVYVSITNEQGLPLRSGIISYDSGTSIAKLEFPENRSINSESVRNEGFYLKKRNSIEHLQIQIEAIENFIKNRGNSFYDTMISGSFPTPELNDDINNLSFYNNNLQNAAKDNNQPIAVKKALGNQKMLLIQGPPGTGKTTVIVEIIQQLVKQGKKVLVCSQAHAAVNNIVDKLKNLNEQNQEMLFVSIGNEGEDELWSQGFYHEDYKKYLENNIFIIRKLVSGENDINSLDGYISKLQYNNAVAEKYKSYHKYIINYYKNSPELYQGAESILNRLYDNSDKFSNNLLLSCRYQTMDVVLGTCIGIGMNRIVRRALHFDTVIIDEAAKANLAETLVPLTLGDRYILVGDHNQLPPYSDTELISQYINKKIQDENEKFDKNILNEAVTISLFEKLYKLSSFPKECIIMLNYQYRMHPNIGHFISDAFYDGKVQMGNSTSLQQINLPSPYNNEITFVDTNKGEQKIGGFNEYETFQNGSFCNNLECEIICDRIIPAIKTTCNLNNLSIGIITPYRAQRDLLKQNLNDEDLKSSVYTIDSIQGSEFDIVIFSFVRSFRYSQQKVGFLDDMRRLNVSLSRAKKKLILVGNKRTLTSPSAHRLYNNINPCDVFIKLTSKSIVYSNPSKAEIFFDKYNIGDTLECGTH